MACIRIADAGDLPAIKTLLDTCDLPHQDLHPGYMPNFLVAPGRERIQGVVGLEPYATDALLRSLAVGPACRSAGLGSRLVATIEVQARQAGILRLYLLTTTASAFFARLGYEAITRSDAPPALRTTRQFSSLCPSQAICMRRALF